MQYIMEDCPNPNLVTPTLIQSNMGASPQTPRLTALGNQVWVIIEMISLQKWIDSLTTSHFRDGMNLHARVSMYFAHKDIFID